MKLSNSALISILGIVALTYLGHRGAEVGTYVTSIVSAYILGRAGLKGSYIYSASKDVSCDTQLAIKTVERIDK
jgi:hypothetical protein